MTKLAKHKAAPLEGGDVQLCQHRLILFAELGDFWFDHGAAVSLVGVSGKVFLVKIFGDIKLLEGGDLSYDRVVPDPCCGDLPDNLFSSLFLFLIVVKN